MPAGLRVGACVAQPPGVEPGGQQDPRPTEQTQQSATTESGANLGLTVLKMAPEAFDLEFVNSNGQHYGYQSNEGPMKACACHGNHSAFDSILSFLPPPPFSNMNLICRFGKALNGP